MVRGEENKNRKREEAGEKNSGSASSGGSFFKGRTFKILLAGIFLLLLAALCVGVGWYLPMEMFSRNPRFTLMHVKVSAHPKGYWKDRAEFVAKIMKVEKGRDNLFSFNLGDLAGRLAARPSIESVSVSRVLPDTLAVSITEREPRALLNSSQSPYVVDSGGILMLRTECMDIFSSLPVILGIRDLAYLKIGENVPDVEVAMEMLRIVRTRWPDIHVDRIIVKPKSLVCAATYRSFPEPFRVEVPKNAKGMPGKVRELATALDRIVNTASPKRNINLMYENRAVLTDLPGRNVVKDRK
ncbi:MAG: FtsQ-type POTRA domain-containing protein [Lentisphaeria bacterium]|nr:FtsQ-type POTRA domain-containing protein [Lentisphaeria bacterium]